MSQSTDTSTRVSLETFKIPKSSFTAFRLLYAPAYEVGEHAKLVFLGKAPDAWYGGQQYGILSRTLKRAKKKVKSKIRKSKLVVDYSLRQTVPETAWWRNVDEVCEDTESEEGMRLPDINNEPAIPQANLSNRIGGDEESSARESRIEDTTLDFNEYNDRIFNEALAEIDSEVGLIITGETPAARMLARNVSFDVDERECDDQDHLQIPFIETSRALSPSKEHVTSIMAHARSNSTDPFVNKPQSVRFEPSLRDSKHSRISYAAPNPETEERNRELECEYIKAHKKHLKTLKKIGHMAQKSGGKARKGGSRVKLKVAHKILSRFKPGEIVRVDRMLVQILRADEFTLMVHYSEKSTSELRITRRWREYNVVLRKADDLLALLTVQFYDAKRGKRFEEKPDYKIHLLPNVRVGFFSHCDRTISVTQTLDTGARVALINAKYENVAFTWLFIVKGILEGDEEVVFNISFPGIRQQISIPMHPSMIKEITRTLPHLEIDTLDYGYHISQGVLPNYLRDRIYAKLSHATHFIEEVKEWLAKNPEPWFCYKLYDRVEWVPRDSKSFLIMHKLWHKSHSLNIRQASRPPLSIEDHHGTVWGKPYPIEGFLGRATNTSGNEVSNFRVFYKISYFYTVENILFLSKMFNAIPPSPTNGLRDPDEEDAMLPEFFIKDPYEVDKHGHIPWLNLPDFTNRDKHTVDELERKIVQIVRADAMIDLLQVKHIKLHSYKKLFKEQLYFHCMFWHSSPRILDDENIIDCALELELQNDSRFILMAPSRACIDEWLRRLNELVAYYKIAEGHRVFLALKNRQRNMETLDFSEYVDSNFVNESHGFETPFSVANDHIFDMSAISMSSCILMSGYLYQKHKKHANFAAFYVVLCPGHLILFSIAKRSKATGAIKVTPCYEHHITIPISECFVYSGNQTAFDLVESDNGSQEKHSGRNHLPRIYPDGWKLCEEELQLCFTLWFGKKRKLRHQLEVANNPTLISMVRLLGITGKSMVFMTRSRVLREAWVTKLLKEITRFSGIS